MTFPRPWWWMKLWHQQIGMKPPGDRIYLCPECNGTVEALMFCPRHAVTWVEPCRDELDTDQAQALVRQYEGPA